jgi:hypothetical protein
MEISASPSSRTRVRRTELRKRSSIGDIHGRGAKSLGILASLAVAGKANRQTF